MIENCSTQLAAVILVSGIVIFCGIQEPYANMDSTNTTIINDNKSFVLLLMPKKFY